jgi:hypothetical protein
MKQSLVVTGDLMNHAVPWKPLFEFMTPEIDSTRTTLEVLSDDPGRRCNGLKCQDVEILVETVSGRKGKALAKIVIARRANSSGWWHPANRGFQIQSLGEHKGSESLEDPPVRTAPDP